MEEYKKMLELTDGSKSETLSSLKKPKPRSQYSRPKKYKLEQDALYLKSTSHKSNEVDGIPKSDVEVLSSMLCPQCLTQFEIHRNYRTLQFLHDLSMHSHNISNLMPVIPYIAGPMPPLHVLRTVALVLLQFAPGIDHLLIARHSQDETDQRDRASAMRVSLCLRHH